MNIRVSPLSLIGGMVGADADFKVGERFTIGPTVSTMKASLLFTELTGFSFGARANWYLSENAIDDSWYVGPTIGYSSMTVSQLGQQGSVGAFTLGTLVGYQWVLDNGFNVNVGGGAAFYMGDDSVVAGNTTLSVPFYSGFVPQAEITVGYAF